MVSVAKPWLICGYHGLTIVSMFFFGSICGKTMVNLWLPWFNYSKHGFLALFVVKPWLIFAATPDRNTRGRNHY